MLCDTDNSQLVDRLRSRPQDPAVQKEQQKAVNEELHALEERWLRLTEQLDNMG